VCKNGKNENGAGFELLLAREGKENEPGCHGPEDRVHLRSQFFDSSPSIGMNIRYENKRGVSRSGLPNSSEAKCKSHTVNHLRGRVDRL
jgi:hypothetical protein